MNFLSSSSLSAGVAVVFLMAVMMTKGLDEKRHRAECLMWSELENKTLPLQNQGHANCTANNECTGFICTGIYQNKELTFGVRVLPCQETPGVEIYGYAPQFHAKNFSHVFTHKSQYDVPGAMLNMSLIPGAISPSFGKMVTGKLEVYLERNKENNTLILGLSAKGCINNTCIFEKPVFNRTEIPVPECTDIKEDVGIKANSMCSVNDIFSCGKNQVCVQSNPASDNGLCECQLGFALQSDGSCVPKDTLNRRPGGDGAKEAGENEVEEKSPISAGVTTGSTSSISSSPKSEPHRAASAGTGAIAAGIVSVLVVILIALGVAAFVIMRTRFAPRLRARITRKPYEDIIIGDRTPGTAGTSSSLSRSPASVMA